MTDDSGYVEFDTIVPGWEFIETRPPGGVVRRTTHIHVKVFSDFKVTTTQLFFPDDYMNELYAGVQPYTACPHECRAHETTLRRHALTLMSPKSANRV